MGASLVNETDIITKLVNSDRAYLIAPAGYGKTQVICQAVALSETGKQLVLTHTHAGVQSLRNRLRQMKVRSIQYEVDTIAGWAQRIISYYPLNSGIMITNSPKSSEWKIIYQAVSRLLQQKFIRKIIHASYSGVYVDEYQDCTLIQHSLIVGLAEIIPCRVLGDPLQGIFGFDVNDVLVDWNKQVDIEFNKLPNLEIPYRWIGKNDSLGAWLKYARKCLLNNQPIDLQNNIINWEPYTEDNLLEISRKVCFSKVKSQESVIAIHPNNDRPESCHNLAKQLGGHYQSIEEMAAQELLRCSKKFDQAKGNKRAIAIIEFASKCSTKVSTELKTISSGFEEKTLPNFSRIRKHRNIADMLLSIAQRTNFVDFDKVLTQIKDIEGAVLYRADLWYEMQYALKFFSSGEYSSLEETAVHTRSQTKYVGRKEYLRVVSRTLLIKGLEYDHAIVLGADKLDAKNLYVAITRGTRSLTILSQTRFLKPLSN